MNRDATTADIRLGDTIASVTLRVEASRKPYWTCTVAGPDGFNRRVKLRADFLSVHDALHEAIEHTAVLPHAWVRLGEGKWRALLSTQPTEEVT